MLMNQRISRFQTTQGKVEILFDCITHFVIISMHLYAYFSDEGDSSSSCDEGKDSLCDLEGPCCQTLRVPPSSPVLVQKKSTSGKKVMFLATPQFN